MKVSGAFKSPRLRRLQSVLFEAPKDYFFLFLANSNKSEKGDMSKNAKKPNQTFLLPKLFARYKNARKAKNMSGSYQRAHSFCIYFG
jgi:hypothetical protein